MERSRMAGTSLIRTWFRICSYGRARKLICVANKRPTPHVLVVAGQERVIAECFEVDGKTKLTRDHLSKRRLPCTYVSCDDQVHGSPLAIPISVHSSSNRLPCKTDPVSIIYMFAVSYTHLRAHETRHDLVC